MNISNRTGTAVAEAPSASSEGDQKVRQKVEALLGRHPYLVLRNIQYECTKGLLTLRGCVPSYYLKQLAQATFASVEGVRQVENHLEVVAS